MSGAISNSMFLTRNPQSHPSLGSPLKSMDKCLQIAAPASTKLSLFSDHPGKMQLTSRRSLIVKATYRDDGRPSSGRIFVGGFVLGGLVVGALGCVYAPQISKALAGANKKDLMRKLPKFIYDEEKVLEKTRKILAEKIAQLNSAIDDVSAQLRSEDAPDGAAVNSDETEAAV